MTRWKSFTVETRREAVDAISHFLLARGSLGTAYDEQHLGANAVSKFAFPIQQPMPYLAFTALMMAGLDGIQNKIHPGDPMDKNLYDLPPEEAAKVPNSCASLDEALEYLDKDRDFLIRGGVFSNAMIDAYNRLKMDKVTLLRMTTHPVEFDMFYSL